MSEAAAPRRKQSSPVVARQGGQASVAVVAAAIAGVCGWLCWRRWKARQDSSSSSRSRSSRSRVGVRPAGKHATTATAAAGSSTQPAFHQPSGRPANMAGGRRVNPKKDKAHKRQQRAEKRLVQHTEATAKAASKQQEEEGPTVQRYVDLTQTAEVYDKVRQYQETGKKRFP